MQAKVDVADNTTLDIATRNARTILARAPSNIRVTAGWDRPLTRPIRTAKERALTAIWRRYARRLSAVRIPSSGDASRCTAR